MQSSSTKQKSLACQQCRVLKVKCIQVEAEPKCLKCTKSGHECNIPTARRPPRAYSKRLRLADLDTKLTGILDQLNQSTAPEKPKQESLTKSPVSGVTPSSNAQLPVNERQPFTNNLSTWTSTDIEVPLQNIGSTSFTTWNHGIGMDAALLDHLLDQFRKRQSYFPFVVIPRVWKARYMMREHPFLLLAAITSVTSGYPSMQDTLADELKRTLAQRVVVREEADLDLLQGLLVHLAWFHYHLIPRSQQAYRQLHVAISMMIDLGLDREPDGVLLQPSEMSSPDGSSTSTSEQLLRERQRTALGCYYLSSTISSPLKRPNRLPFTEYAFKCAASLKETAEYDSDQLFPPLIRLQRILEQTRDFYDTEGSKAISQVHVHAKRLHSDLQEWRYGIPDSTLRYGLLINQYHAAKVSIYEMGLVFHFDHKKSLALTAGCNKTTSDHQAVLVSNLATCVEALREYLDVFLAMEVSTYPHLPFEEWNRVILAFFILYRLSVNLPEVSTWDISYARLAIDLEGYLTQAIDRILRSRPDEGGNEIASADLYSVLPEILESAKASYVLRRDHPEQVPAGLKAHINVGTGAPFRNNASSTHNTLTSSMRVKCPATGFWAREARQTDGQPHQSTTMPYDGSFDEIQPLDETFWESMLGLDDGALE